MAGAVSWLYAEPLAEVIYRKLSQDIGDGVYPPGTRLVQDQVAGELGVSRTPVREALQRLAQDGYADRVHGRGYVVRAPSVIEISHVYQVRAQLEPAAVRLAFDYYSALNRAEFRRLAGATAGPRDRNGEYFETNRAFHLALVAPCPNPILVTMIGNLWDLPVNRMISQQLVSARRDPDAWRDEHFAIVAAIDADDVELTVQLMERHLRNGLDADTSANDTPAVRRRAVEHAGQHPGSRARRTSGKRPDA